MSSRAATPAARQPGADRGVGTHEPSPTVAEEEDVPSAAAIDGVFTVDASGAVRFDPAPPPTERVVSALGALPALSVAFERGALSWTQVRLLVVAVARETEQAWLAVAEGRTVRALEAIIRDANARARVDEGAIAPPTTAGTAPATDRVDATDPMDAADPVPATDAAHDLTETLDDCAEDGPLTDGEPSVTLRLRCPRWVAPLWRASLEMARRVAGEPLATWRAAEAIAAEGLAAPRTFEPCARETDRVLAGSADRRAPTVDADETRATLNHAAAFDTIDGSAVVEALPEDVERLARNVTACDAHALDARLGAARHALRPSIGSSVACSASSSTADCTSASASTPGHDTCGSASASRRAQPACSSRSSARRGSRRPSWRRAAAAACRHCAHSRSRPSSTAVPLRPGSSARAR